MKLEEVLPAFRAGKKVRRRAWDEGEYLTEFGSLPMKSIVADDWEIVKEKVKKTRTVWINCYAGDKQGKVHTTAESAENGPKAYDFLFTKEVTFEWEVDE
jgi:hypothetical protein